ncbi:DUF6371 domain-containing protein [Chryseobacterium salipaludis]|uniref:DUF6371 domain-containing protein n=1 Tax=Chryseobacterium TaxID=59732 RepID=UPI001FF3D535|nr:MULTISPECIES: DUF6371 domain-containing protein [Chryseobacterium]MCJ8498557.1 DUF6371 domain-containing protein [Chryseobacterium salipaludis]MCX3297118.1 DUF6371 domain-containing protein [Planobacterium sp. JC490]
MTKTNNFRYTLDKSPKKYPCPQCGKKTFVLYRDQGGTLQSGEYGRCDRADNCGYLRYPESEYTPTAYTPPPPPKPQVYFPAEVFHRTLKDNNPLKAILTALGAPAEQLDKVLKIYRIGAVKDAVCLPFIDRFDRVHSVQVKTFNSECKTTHTTWLHSIIYQDRKAKNKTVPQWLADYYQNEIKTRCFFGEHLLEEHPDKQIIIAESPKNAILGAVFMPEYLWLASGSLSTLNVRKLQNLKGREILLLPDTSVNNVAFDTWDYVRQQAADKGLQIKMLDFLECTATEEQKAAGYDVADFILEQLQQPESCARAQEATPPQSLLRSKDHQHTREQRISVGMQFPVQEVAEMIYPAFTEGRATGKQLRQSLEAGGLIGDDVPDLMDVMVLQGIITATEYPYYIFHAPQN